MAQESGDALRSSRRSSAGIGISWLQVVWLMLSDIVGTSVLTFTGVARQLGAVLTVAFILGLFPLSLYVSVLMSRTRRLLLKAAALAGSGAPEVGTMGEVAVACFGTQRAGTAVYVAVYGYTLLGQSSYLLVLGTSMQQFFTNSGLCVYVAVGLSCIALLAPVFSVRRLGESVLLCFVNTLLIVAVIILALSHIAAQKRAHCSTAHAFAPNLSVMTALGAATNVVYSFAGQWMYFELMSTMAVPEQFPRAFAVAGPFMIIAYLIVALCGYGLGASQSDLVASMDRGLALRVASFMLFSHVLIVYLIKSVVLARYCHGLLWPGDVEARTALSYMRHGSCGVAMLLFGFCVANAVPFFSQLLGLIGGLCAGPINFILPIVLYLFARQRYIRVADEFSGVAQDVAVEEVSKSALELATVQPADGSPERPADRSAAPRASGASADPAEGAASPQGGLGEEDTGSATSSSNTRVNGAAAGASAGNAAAEDSEPFTALDTPVHMMGWWEVPVICFTVVVILMTMVLGVAEEVHQVIELQGEFGAPFACHALVTKSSGSSCPSSPSESGGA